MRLVFIGDVHGHALHALRAVKAVRQQDGDDLAAVIQVGDLGAYPSLDRVDASSRYYIEANPSQGDLFKVLAPDPELEERLRDLRTELPGPVLFVSGNHEDHKWLDQLHRRAGSDTVAIDPLGLFVHVADGTVVDFAGVSVGFLGGIDFPGAPFDLNEEAMARLREADSIDVLVTHDGPYGMCENWRGDTQGSRRLTELVDELQPRFHVSGPYHHVNGPRRYGRTLSYALAQLVPPAHNRWTGDPINPEQRIAPGSVGVLKADGFAYIEDDWLTSIR